MLLPRSLTDRLVRLFNTAIVLCCSFSAVAQLPQSVDIDLAGSASPDSLEVRVRSNGAGFSQLVTGITFTVRWSSASAATLGASYRPCPSGVPINASPQVTSGAYHYLTFNAFSLDLLGDVCPGEVWPADQWIVIMRTKVNGLSGCEEFNIVNDAWTGANNRDYFISLNGQERVGTIEPTPISLGICGADCLGVVGGPALPGTVCDDGDPCTTGDVWNASCVCVGTFADADLDGTCDALDGCPNDPLKVEPGVCGCGVADTDTDADGTADCVDGCPNDPLKVEPGICGCGVADTDTDADGTADCVDGCPNDPLKVEPGVCGCGVADTDSDGDGVADCIDDCPELAGQVGSPCDDGDPATVNDVITDVCACVGSPLNDACATATVLLVQAPADCPGNASAGDNSNAMAEAGNTACDPGGPLADVWYTFDSGDNLSVTIALDPGTMTAWGVGIYTDCDSSEVYCESGTSVPFELAVTPFTTYLIRVYTPVIAGAGGSHSICVSSGVGTSIPSQGILDWSISPNPSNGVFMVRNPGPPVVADLRLVDLSGRQVARVRQRVEQDGRIAVDGSAIATGVYVLRIQAGGRSLEKRVVIDR